MSDDTEEGVGFGRPPKARQFGQPGGNRRGRGRKKGSRNVATILTEALSAQITVKEGGKGERKISKLDAGLTQLANKAASGDLKAIQLVIALCQSMEATREADSQPLMPLTDADRRVLGILAERLRKAQGGEADE